MLAELGARLFVQTYGPTHPEPELTPYLTRSFSAAALARALADASACVLVAETPEGDPIGYALLRAGADDPPADLPAWARALRPLEIGRFYVDAPWHGLGVAPQLMEACIEEARRREAGVLWLAVWQEAPRPQRFYARMGFRVVGATTFRFGARIDQDHVMLRAMSRCRPRLHVHSPTRRLSHSDGRRRGRTCHRHCRRHRHRSWRQPAVRR